MYRFFTFGLFSYLTSYGFTRGFDAYNIEKMREVYYTKGKKPRYKSYVISIILTALFGGYGMVYITPRTGLFLGIIDFLFLPLLMIIRPFEIGLVILAIVSHNRVRDELQSEFDAYDVKSVSPESKVSQNLRYRPHVNGRRYQRNPYVS